MAVRRYHDFYAPVDGVARKFSMRCDDGAVMWLGCMEPLPAGDISRLYGAMDCIIKLLRHDMPWRLFTTSTNSSAIGAVIEAAENRRAEIYGPLESAA